ncbi:metallophosphoesterase [Streptomyces graminilatus]|uniref:metallophosphoesterase n=1 Tax=Streptomyces graminilatus TaxID=1464070 RepID=UPI000ADC60C5
MSRAPRLLAVSDLHISYEENRRFLEQLSPTSDEDWLIVAGDIAENSTDIAYALGVLARRFAKVIWVPGNHELWTTDDDPVQLRGEARYRHLVGMCRSLGVVTPEDPFPVWHGSGEPVTVAPLFLLYDYTLDDGARRCALRGGVDRLPPRMAAARPSARRPAGCAPGRENCARRAVSRGRGGARSARAGSTKGPSGLRTGPSNGAPGRPCTCISPQEAGRLSLDHQREAGQPELWRPALDQP